MPDHCPDIVVGGDVDRRTYDTDKTAAHLGTFSVKSGIDGRQTVLAIM
jgi:hypothetical protein